MSEREESEAIRVARFRYRDACEYLRLWALKASTARARVEAAVADRTEAEEREQGAYKDEQAARVELARLLAKESP